MNRGYLVVAFACLFVVSVGATTAAPSGSALTQEGIDTDDVLMSISVESDGDAEWTIEYRTRLETDDDEAAFEELREDIENDPEPYAERFRERMEVTAESAESATGREMAIDGMTVTAEKRELPREYGVLRYEFRWSNFAALEDDRLIVGDAIDGLFLDTESSLLLSWPETYGLIEASPQPSETRDGSVVYGGPTDFGDGEPRVELGPQGAATPAEGAATGDSFPIGVAVVVLLLVAAAGAFVVYRWRDEPVDEPVRGDNGKDQPPGATGTDDSGPDTELLSNEEQVLRLIESEGGRMKQKAVAEELGWTDAKTSQVTKTLREEGDLEGFRLGRENVLSLPEDASGTE